MWEQHRKQMRKLKAEEKAAKDEREKKLARLRMVCQRAKAKLQQSCAARRDATRSEARAKVEASKQSRRQAREDYSELKRFERQAEERRRKHRKLPAEARQESDDTVRQNIPAELLPVFEKVKRSIRGTPMISRTEAFLQYVEENPDDVQNIIEAAIPSDDEFAAAYAAWADEAAA
jgi:chromosome segregation ATPase